MTDTSTVAISTPPPTTVNVSSLVVSRSELTVPSPSSTHLPVPHASTAWSPPIDVCTLLEQAVETACRWNSVFPAHQVHCMLCAAFRNRASYQVRCRPGHHQGRWIVLHSTAWTWNTQCVTCPSFSPQHPTLHGRRGNTGSRPGSAKPNHSPT